MDISFSGKNVLVGGGSAGIGQAVAIELALLGASVTLLARTESSLQATIAMLDTSQHQQHNYLVADFSDSRQLIKSLDSVLQQKTIHILINNTGGPPGGPIVDARESDFLSAYHNHLICNQ
mgnify:FL=1